MYKRFVRQYCNSFMNVYISTYQQLNNYKTQFLTNFLSNLRSFSCISTLNSSDMLNCLPLCLCGEIVKGFQRGSKELGIPTANFSKDFVNKIPASLKVGVYYGWASIETGEVYKMVLSVGWNPFYVNKHKSMETHILHEFNGDLYGCLLRICIIGYLRPEKDFNSLEDLICAIRTDISQAERLLDEPNYAKYKEHSFFQNDPILNAIEFTPTSGKCT